MRGGVAVLIRNKLWEQLHDLKVEKDQVWFKMQHFPDFIFGAVYIAPRDSLFFNIDSYAILQEYSQSSLNCVVLGDLNSRIANLSQLNTPLLSYVTNLDSCTNTNGAELLQTCISNDLKLVNHAVFKGKEFKGNLTYKQKDTWTSQLDWAIVSPHTFPLIEDFSIMQDTDIPTDHAPISIKLIADKANLQSVLDRSQQLGISIHRPHPAVVRPIPMNSIDPVKFSSVLPSPDTLLNENPTSDSLSRQVSSMLYDAAASAKKENESVSNISLSTRNNRWLNLIKSKDSKQIWKSIDWNGKFDAPTDQQDKPSDQQFCEHFSNLLNPEHTSGTPEYSPNEIKYMPILDDPITPGEVETAVKKLKSNKAAGCDGVAPGLLKLLSEKWILILTFLFNLVFEGSYPHEWAVSKMFTIFKKGERLLTGNYRGICIINAVAKLYDMILGQRLSMWYTPKEEQAGSQKNRGCEEQILTIKLIIDVARKTKKKLYIAFIDYVKAYDMVNRVKLAKMLDEKGCGSKYLKALQRSLNGSSCQIGDHVFTTSSGVKQGGSTSCGLFTFFIDPTIESVNSCGLDDWLGSLHTLLLMDDTVIFATSRERLAMKLAALKRCTDDIGMIIHPTKSQFISVNVVDHTPFILDDVTVSATDEYIYLGSLITNDKAADNVKKHVTSKHKHTMKYLSFLRKNSDAPYSIKKVVWNSALLSSVFYGCETWLCKDLKCTSKPYMTTLKALLGVRPTTCNDLVLIEAGVLDAKAFIIEKQKQFFKKLLSRPNFQSSYLHNVIQMSINAHSEMGVYLSNLMDKLDDVSDSNAQVKDKVLNSDSTRRVEYRKLNPTLSVHPMYSREIVVSEHARIYMSRIRLSSHRLKVETGRWARIPRDQRLCECGQIQNEFHVLVKCPLNKQIRKEYPRCETVISLADLFDSVTPVDIGNLASYCAKIISKYE